MPEYSNLRNRPNPFTMGTEVRFRLDRKVNVTMSVFDVRGRRVTTLHRDPMRRANTSWYGTEAIRLGGHCRPECISFSSRPRWGYRTTRWFSSVAERMHFALSIGTAPQWLKLGRRCVLDRDRDSRSRGAGSPQVVRSKAASAADRPEDLVCSRLVSELQTGKVDPT